MEKFGSEWVRHKDKIFAHAWNLIGPQDIFLIPGDLSWAKKRKQAEPDLKFLASLPGIKVCIKGNHDFWWESDTPLEYPGLLSPPVVLDDGRIGIAGSRGWDHPENGSRTRETDRKVFEREQVRLEKNLNEITHCRVRIGMTHYPPQPYLPQFKKAGVQVVAYGHVHMNSLPKDEKLAVFGEVVEGIPLYCVACDRIDFKPQCILTVD
ncbi:MAG: metallophosphoesterase [Armatimonadaceae bacterium]